jgi:uncharacterized membrane protein YdbT with pleckstrin-like domain
MLSFVYISTTIAQIRHFGTHIPPFRPCDNISAIITHVVIVVVVVIIIIIIIITIIIIILMMIKSRQKDTACSTYGGEEKFVQDFGGET